MMETDDHAIKPGDTVILHLAHNNLIPICVSAGSKTDTRSGTINHNFHLLNSNRYFNSFKILLYSVCFQLKLKVGKLLHCNIRIIIVYVILGHLCILRNHSKTKTFYLKQKKMLNRNGSSQKFCEISQKMKIFCRGLLEFNI